MEILVILTMDWPKTFFELLNLCLNQISRQNHFWSLYVHKCSHNKEIWRTFAVFRSCSRILEFSIFWKTIWIDRLQIQIYFGRFDSEISNLKNPILIYSISGAPNNIITLDDIADLCLGGRFNLHISSLVYFIRLGSIYFMNS